MIFFGHIGITLFFGTLLSLSIFSLIIGSILPDLIDKPFQLLGISTSGRFIGHTLFMGLLISGISFLIFRKKSVSISLLFGHWFHLLQDAQYFVPWFYPFINYDFPAYPFGPKLTLINIIFELLGVVSLVYVVRTNSNFRNLIFDKFKVLIDNKKRIPE
jgi:hypothetical protein